MHTYVSYDTANDKLIYERKIKRRKWSIITWNRSM